MAEQDSERDSGFSIDDILHEQAKTNPIKRLNPLSSCEVDQKREKTIDGIDHDHTAKYKDTLHPSTTTPDSAIANNDLDVHKHGDAPQEHPSSSSSGFGIAQLLSSKDSFLAKSMVVHDNKSNISQKGMTFLEKLNSFKTEENETSAHPLLTPSENLSSRDDVELDKNANLFLSPQLSQTLQCTDQSQVTGEENEITLIDTNCKLYLFDKETNSWKNIGMINLHVNEYIRKEDDPSDKFYTRIVARSLSLQRAVLNFKLWPNIVIDLPTENTILMQASYMNDLDNIRFVSLSMKATQAHDVWRVIKDKAEELNFLLAKKDIVRKFRENHENCDDMDDEEIFEMISEKNEPQPTKKIKLLDSKKVFIPPDDTSSDEADEEDDDDEDEDEDDDHDNDDDNDDHDVESSSQDENAAFSEPSHEQIDVVHEDSNINSSANEEQEQVSNDSSNCHPNAVEVMVNGTIVGIENVNDIANGEHNNNNNNNNYSDDDIHSDNSAQENSLVEPTNDNNDDVEHQMDQQHPVEMQPDNPMSEHSSDNP